MHRGEQHSLYHLDAFNNMRSFRVELCGVPVVGFLLAVFQPVTLMILQKSMPPTVMTIAKPTVSDDPLRSLPAVLIGASDLLWRHATP